MSMEVVELSGLLEKHLQFFLLNLLGLGILA